MCQFSLSLLTDLPFTAGTKYGGTPRSCHYNARKQTHGLCMTSHLTLACTFQVEGGAKMSFGGEQKID